MTRKLEACTNAVKEAQNQELLDLVSRRLYEMAAVCVMSHLLPGISREHLSRIESGKVAVTEEMKVKLLEALEKFNPCLLYTSRRFRDTDR